MKLKTNYLKVLLGATALTAFTAVSAHAGGTAAGTDVQNTFTLDYQVSGVAQPTIDNTATPTQFTVDRLVDLTVASNGDTTVAPGAQDQDLVFSLTNDGNDTQAYDLTVVDETGDEFSSTGTNVVYYVDDGDGVFEPGGDDGAPITYNGTATGDVAPDDTLWVVVESDIPTGLTDADEDVVSLVADTLEPSTSASAGTPLTADSDGNSLTGAAENVLADGTGTSNELANEGDHSATATYIVASADVSGTKAVSIYSEDGSGCATIPGTPAGGYSVPGACVEYTITVENTGGTAATDIIINDILDDNLLFVAADLSGFTGGSFASPALPAVNTDCVAGACEINLTGATLAAGSVATPTVGVVTIRAIVK